MNMDTPVGEIDFARHMQAVALQLLGEPNSRPSKTELRYGNRGSLSIDLQKGLWHDHETGVGGGVLGLIERETGHRVDGGAAAKWFRENIPGVVDAAPVGARRPRCVAATYRYEDEVGKHLFDVLRYDPKDFRQRGADGTWKTSTIRKVLYRLPRILAAPVGSFVYIVEGEKDVHRLEAEGLLATTNPGGAGKWREDYSAALVGKTAVIVPDNDDAGRDHAEKVQASLRAAGVTCVVVNLEGLPDKGDVSDWLAEGYTGDELYEIAAKAIEAGQDSGTDAGQAGQKPKAGFALIRADLLEFREPDWLIEGLLEAGTLGLIFGDPGSGKSFAALDMAASVATGRAFHGRTVKRGAVIYICGEGQNGIMRRLTAWERHHGGSLAGAPLYVSHVAAQFLSAESVKAVVAAIDAVAQEAGDVALIVIDTLNRNMGPGDESSTSDMTAFVAAVDEVKDRYQATALTVHHTGHGNKERARGSMALLGALDTEYRIERADDMVTMQCTKMKDGASPPPLAFRLSEIEVGRTRFDEPITSAALTKTEAPGPAPRGLPAKVRQALETFMEAKRREDHDHDPSEGVHVDNWRKVFYEQSTADTTEAKKKAFQRSRDNLVKREFMTVRDDVYRLSRVPPGLTFFVPHRDNRDNIGTCPGLSRDNRDTTL